MFHRLILICLITVSLFFPMAHTQEAKKSPFRTVIQALRPKKLKNPRVILPIFHPAKQKIDLSRIAFIPVIDDENDKVEKANTEEFVQTTLQYFVGEPGISVLDRKNTKRLFEEINFTKSGLVEEKNAIKYGKLVGASSLLLMDVIRLDTEESGTSDTVNGKIRYKCTTRVTLKATIQAVDISTGRMLAATTVEFSKSSTNTGDEPPSCPPTGHIRSQAFSEAAKSIKKHFLPWTESRNLVFFNGKRFNMKEAYYALESKDYAEAWELMSDGLAEAKMGGKPKFTSQAYYNMAVMNFSRGKFQLALRLLKQAHNLHPDSIYREFQSQIRDVLKLEAIREETGNENPAFSYYDQFNDQESKIADSRKELGLEENILRLKKLRDNGTISEREYITRRDKLLDDIMEPKEGDIQ